MAKREYRLVLEQLLERYKDRVFHLAYGMLRDRASAEDAAQDIFLRIWKGLPGYNGKASLSTWIYTISRNACLTAIRKRSIRPTVSIEALSDDDGPEWQVEDTHESAQAGAEMDIDHYLRELPDNYRQAITLYYLEQRSYEEAAEMLDVPLGTLKTLIFRARKQLLKIAARKQIQPLDISQNESDNV